MFKKILSSVITFALVAIMITGAIGINSAQAAVISREGFTIRDPGTKEVPSATYFVHFKSGNVENVSGMPNDITITVSGKTRPSFVIPNTVPQSTGARFIGWNTKADGKGKMYYVGDKVQGVSLSKNFNLYAMWEKSDADFITHVKFSSDVPGKAREVFNLDYTGKISDVPTFTAPDMPKDSNGLRFYGWLLLISSECDYAKHDCLYQSGEIIELIPGGTYEFIAVWL